MNVQPIDGYLLDGRPGKAAAIAAALAAGEGDERAAPFVRGLRAVGERAADETLVALRLIVAGRPAADDAVRRLRSLAALAREPARADAVFARDGDVLADVAGQRGDPAGLAAAVRAAYRAELG